jgi:hypothetical protein
LVPQVRGYEIHSNNFGFVIISYARLVADVWMHGDRMVESLLGQVANLPRERPQLTLLSVGDTINRALNPDAGFSSAKGL